MDMCQPPHQFDWDENGDVICRACGLRGRNGSPAAYRSAMAWAISVLEGTSA